MWCTHPSLPRYLYPLYPLHVMLGRDQNRTETVAMYSTPVIMLLLTLTLVLVKCRSTTVVEPPTTTQAPPSQDKRSSTTNDTPSAAGRCN